MMCITYLVGPIISLSLQVESKSQKVNYGQTVPWEHSCWDWIRLDGSFGSQEPF